jgi:hypothetical protein
MESHIKQLFIHSDELRRRSAELAERGRTQTERVRSLVRQSEQMCRESSIGVEDRTPPPRKFRATSDKQQYNIVWLTPRTGAIVSQPLSEF